MKYSLDTVAHIINDNIPSYKKAAIRRVYRDFGAGIMWDTIVVENIETGDSYQALYPKLHDDIVNGKDISIEQIEGLLITANKLLDRKEFVE